MQKGGNKEDVALLAMYLTMLETDADRERFAHLYDVCNKLVFATAFSILKNKM